MHSLMLGPMIYSKPQRNYIYLFSNVQRLTFFKV
jgi:hypothetical protein